MLQQTPLNMLLEAVKGLQQYGPAPPPPSDTVTVYRYCVPRTTVII